MQLCKQILIVVSISLTLVACGGGEGHQSTAPATQTPQPPTSPSSPPLQTHAQIAPVPHALSKISADTQIAAPATAVAVAPMVLVTDSSGTPVTDVEVSFAVTSGGGSVVNAVVRTNSTGHASCGSWTLGSAKGTNTLKATVQALSPVTFSASAINASNDISLNLLQPSTTQPIGATMTVVVAVTSTFQLADVTASVNGGSSVPLARSSSSGNSFRADLSLLTLPRGDMQLVVTATDVFAHTTDLITVITHDVPPTISLTSPTNDSVARGNIPLAASCADDDPAGCSSLTVWIKNGPMVASGVNISQSLSLAEYEGQEITLYFIGIDSAQQQTTASRKIYVESSGRLSTVAEVSGSVWDVSGTRILFLDSSGAVRALKVYDAITTTTTLVETSADFDVSFSGYGYLTPTGAIYVRGADNNVFPFSALYEWRTGTLMNLGGLNSGPSLKVSGDWAIYSSDQPSITLTSRNLGTGVSSPKTMDAGNTSNDVAANGDIVYWSAGSGSAGYNIYRIRGGGAQPLTADSPATTWNTYPLTDGINVAYRKSAPCCIGQTYRIAMHDGVSETVLTNAFAAEVSPDSDYAVAGGHVVYVKEDLAGKRQVWRRTSGVDQQITFFGSSSKIEAVAPDGSVILKNTTLGKRYRAIPGAALETIGSTLGRVIYRNGKFVVILDRTVLDVNP